MPKMMEEQKDFLNLEHNFHNSTKYYPDFIKTEILFPKKSNTINYQNTNVPRLVKYTKC